MPLDLSDPKIKQVLNNLKDNGANGDWIQLGFVPKTEKIQISEEGNGLSNLVDELNDGKIFWNYICFVSGGLKKFVYISWIGDGVTGVLKGKFSTQSQDMEKWFKQNGFNAHVTINARSEKDINENDIQTKLKKATGSSYDSAQGNKSKFQGVSEGVTNVKEGQQKVTTEKQFVKEEFKLDTQQRENFWQQTSQEQERLKREEERRIEEEKKQKQVDLNKRNQFWEKNQAQKTEETKTVNSNQLQELSQKRDQFWQNQQEQKPTQPTKTAPPVKGNASGFKAKFEKLAKGEEPVKKTPPPTKNPIKKTPPPTETPKPQPPPETKPQLPPPTKTQPPPETKPQLPPPTKTQPPPETKPQLPPPTKTTPPPPPQTKPQLPPPTPVYSEGEYSESEGEYNEGEGEYNEGEGEYNEGEGEYNEGEGEYNEGEGEYNEGEGEYNEGEGEGEYGEGYSEGEYGGSQCRAVADWVGENDGDLTFYIGDVITITDDQSDPNGWWTGTFNGYTGTFPSNYVERI